MDAEALTSELVVQAARLVRAVRRESELPAGVRTLSLLDQYGPLGVSALAELDRSSQPTASATVAQLAEQGLVTKTAHPTDRRASVVTLTAAGRDELSRVRAANGERVAARLARYPEHTVADLATAVAVLRRVVDDPAAGPGPAAGVRAGAREGEDEQ